MKKLSVLQFVNVRWYNAEAHYGIVLSKKLAENGHNIFVCGIDGTPPIIQAKKLGLKTLTSLTLHHYNPIHLFKDISILADFIKKEKIQIINAHKSEGHFLGAVYKKFFDKNVILIRTRGDVRYPKKYFINEWLYNFTDKIITSSKLMEQDYFKELNVNKNKIITIYNAVDTTKFNPDIIGSNIRKEFGISENEILIGIIGRLSPVKGHKYFVNAAKEIIREFPNTKFLISGKESQIKYNDLRNQAKQLGIEERIIFSGVHADPAMLMSSLDIGVVASIGSETNCRVTQELMACAKPVVATNVGVIPEVLLDRKCGLIVPPKNHIKMSQAIMEIIRNKDYADSIALNARKRMVEEFNEDLFAEKTLEVYYESLKR